MAITRYMTKASLRRTAPPPVVTHEEWIRLPIEQRLAHTERLLKKPTPAPFAGLPLYEGRNDGKVNLLIVIARHLAKGAVNDAMSGICTMADEWRKKQNEEFRDLVARLTPKQSRELLKYARKLERETKARAT